MARLTSHLPLGTSALVGALAVLSGCSGTTSPGSDDHPTPEGVSKIVYAVRQHTVVEDGKVATIDVAGGMGQVMDYGRYVPGGRLELRDLRSGTVENILEGYKTADVSSVDLSFDATKVLFTMKKDAQDQYHVYWAGLTRVKCTVDEITDKGITICPSGKYVESEDGKFPINQLTFGPYDDQQAVWAAGDRIVFTTNQAYTDMGTRADEYNHARVVTQLASITLAGGDADRKLCSQNLSHIVTLFSMADGRVGFSRWEHLENVNDVKLMAMNPDCTQMIGLNGQFGKPGNSLVQFTESKTPYVYYGIVTNRENTIQAGALVKLDARWSGDLTKLDMEKTSEEAYSMLTPNVPTGDEASPVGRYRSPSTLPNGKLLVTWAPGDVNELNELSLTPPDYGIYVYDLETRRNNLVVNYEDTWELYAKPVVTRDTPEIITSRQDMVDASTPALFGSIDVAQTSLYSRHGNTVGGAQFADGTHLDQALKSAVKVRIIEGFSSEAAMETMFGLTMAEGAALIGEAKVEADGSWLASVPPYIPMHLQAIDEFELAIRNETTWIQGMPGEDRVCGGCHEDRTQPSLPNGQALTIARGRGPEDFMTPVLQRTEYPWAAANDPANPNQIQTLLNAKCVSCHNEKTNGNKPQEFYEVRSMNMATGASYDYMIPRLDLTDRPITVTYDRQTRAWPASYVSLFYPSAMEMEMEKAEVIGTVPPKWAVPSDARHSAVIEKLNITSMLDTTKYAWTLGEAFSDPNIAGGTRTDHAQVAGLTRDEVRMLIRAIDMGGQYFARQNTGFVPFNNDPVAGKAY